MWMMLQAKMPVDYVIGTGNTYSVKHLCEVAFETVGLDYRDSVIIDERFYRPADVDLLVADPSKANQELGWHPKVEFEDLIKMMVDTDLTAIGREMS
jgi:GDPmannose 4,6-dehydratase